MDMANNVGKDLYRAKSHEEDIKIINEVSHNTSGRAGGL